MVERQRQETSIEPLKIDGFTTTGETHRPEHSGQLALGSDNKTDDCGLTRLPSFRLVRSRCGLRLAS